jgi:hypothetical protein
VTTAAVASEALAIGLGDRSHNQVHESRPDGGAPNEDDQEIVVRLAPRALHGRAHELSVLSLVVVVQLGWMATIGYGVFYLLS